MNHQHQVKLLEASRQVLHDYIISKLIKRDYHAVQDAASDLRELEVEIRILSEFSMNQSNDVALEYHGIQKSEGDTESHK